jgi:hypothetical protein
LGTWDKPLTGFKFTQLWAGKTTARESFFREIKYPCTLEEKNILCNILFYPTRVSVLTQSVIFIYLTGGKS